MDSRFFAWSHRCSGHLEHDFWESYAFSVSEEGIESWSNALADKEEVVDLTEYFPVDERNRFSVLDLDSLEDNPPAWMLEVHDLLYEKWAPAGALRTNPVSGEAPRWIFFGWDNT